MAILLPVHVCDDHTCISGEVKPGPQFTTVHLHKVKIGGEIIPSAACEVVLSVGWYGLFMYVHFFWCNPFPSEREYHTTLLHSTDKLAVQYYIAGFIAHFYLMHMLQCWWWHTYVSNGEYHRNQWRVTRGLVPANTRRHCQLQHKYVQFLNSDANNSHSTTTSQASPILEWGHIN